MKEYLCIALGGILLNSCSIKQEKETRSLDTFDKIHVVGNVELHLKRNSEPSMAIMAENADDLANLITEVRDGELHIYAEQDCDACEAPEYDINLNHSGISKIILRGVMTLRSEDVIDQKVLVINGDGILNGNLEVSVDTLSVDLKGISNMNISGRADAADLKVAGIGMIDAGDLETNSGNEVSKGIAIINK